MPVSRRKFLKTSAAASVAMAAPTVHASPRGRRYRTALIGSGWWGKVIAEVAMADGSVDIVAVCDVDQAMADDGVALVQGKSGNTPKRYRHFQELLDAERPDICIVATPDHWHPLICIAACQAGAHVYVEKPVGHTILEGRAMVTVARETDRIVQVGTHRRLTPHGISAREFLTSGGAGKIGMVRASVTGGAGTGQPGEQCPDQDPPPGLDWDMWCGPAPYRPYNPVIHPKKWRQFSDYGNGQIGDWVHWTDQIMSVLGDDKHPTTVNAVGGTFVRDPSALADTPDTLDVHWEFEDAIATWEHRQYAGSNQERARIGCYFYGTKGVCHVGWADGWTFYPLKKSGREIHEDPQLHQPGSQNVPELWADFIDAIVRKIRPTCDIEIGHHSTAISLLGMLSWKLGRSVQWDGIREECPGDEQANQLLRRVYRKPWTYPDV